MVLTESVDTVGSVLAQMTPRDTVVIAYSDVESTVGWAAIHGAKAEFRQDIPRVPSGGELRDMPIWRFDAALRRGQRPVRDADGQRGSAACLLCRESLIAAQLLNWVMPSPQAAVRSC